MGSWKADARCIDCFRRGLGSFMRSGGMSRDDADPLLENYMVEIGRLVLAGEPPPLAGAGAYRDLRARLHGADIFQDVKKAFTRSLAGMLPGLRRAASASGTPLRDALGMATWGNLIDVAQDRPLPDPAIIPSMLSAALAVDQRDSFIGMLGTEGTLVILGDNAGETVLDRLVLELLPPGVRTYYAVRPEPVLNDATREDAEDAGIDSLATILHTGMDAPTVTLREAGPELAGALELADVVLAKGQGNLEGLCGCGDGRLFHSFVVKCGVISDLTGLAQGSAVFVNNLDVAGGVSECPSTNTCAASAT